MKKPPRKGGFAPGGRIDEVTLARQEIQAVAELVPALRACTPTACMPIARAAPRDRSSVTPRVNGPRSLITTVTELPF